MDNEKDDSSDYLSGSDDEMLLLPQHDHNGHHTHKRMSLKPIASWQFWKQRRYVVAMLAFFGFFNIYSLRVNLSIAIVAMTEKKALTLPNGTTTYEQEFDWDSKLQGYILSSFFYGYVTTQIFGGWLSAKIGGKRVFAFGIAVTSILTIITPFLARASVYLLLTVRIVEGIFEGVTYPCIHAVWARWAPPLERSRIATLAFSGSYVGTVVAMPVCAYLAEGLGWPSIFYVFGALGLIWSITWWLVVSESPEEDPHISAAELQYIKDSMGTSSHNANIKHPWKSIILSAPVWAIIVSHFAENWGFYTLMTQLPKYLNDIMDLKLGTTGILSGIPYLAMAVMLPISGHVADKLREKKILSTTHVRKLFNCFGFIAQCVFMLIVGFVMNKAAAVICLTLAVGLGAFAWAGFSVNHLDVAPQHASVLMGFSNTFATIPGILSPIISGYVVTTPTVEEWRIVFYITSGVYLFGCAFYGIFASGKLQPWAVESQPLQMKRINHKESHDNKSYVPDV